MGDTDINVKNFIKIDSVFAQLFSQGVYGGQVEIDPGKLQEFDTASQDAVSLGGGKIKSLERLRDAEKAKENKELKKYADGVSKGTKILPMVTLVFYTGSQPWDGPESVYDMLDIPENMKGWMKHTTPDYRMNLIDARHMTDEEIDRFDGDLKAFLLMLRDRFDREKLKSVVAMHRETWYAISEIKKDRRYVEYIDRVSDEELKGGVNMDAALDYIESVGEEKVNRLGIMLTEAGRTEDFLRSLSDKGLQKKLFVEFGLEEMK